jgi:outer membrane lipase/esterase
MKTPKFTPLVSAAALAISAILAAPSQANAYSELVFFGDSVSDSGNVALALNLPFGLAQAVSNTYIPDAPYPTDGVSHFPATFSNGPVWTTQFAGKLGLLADPSLIGGTNFAFAGARTGRETDVPSLKYQATTMYLGATGGIADPNALYVVAEVGNDARDVLAGEISFADGASDYAKNLGDIVDALQDAGAQHILVFNNANLGLVPFAAALGPEAAGAASAVSAGFNLALGARLAGKPGVDVFDLYSFFSGVVGDKAQYGFENATDACGAAAPGTDCSKYVFWDGIHPTTAMHKLVSDAVYAQMIPEPGTYALTAFGLVAVGIAARRRKALA